jgi:hypothetical protein
VSFRFAHVQVIGQAVSSLAKPIDNLSWPALKLSLPSTRAASLLVRVNFGI